ncbi:MAG: nicotinate-nucleotide diphosphorylase (carboxylating) [Nitrospirae bacterium 13_2_20CM_2_62_8]|nr:MAG: nicotinate-nucleotide diphosphorylase (carboxylating) [Nitrospirae bacterium 13_2_20CM_2_62_8]
MRKAVQVALEEDLGQGDATTAALFPKPVPARGTIVAHEAMTVAGVAAARQTFLAVDRSVKVVRTVRDGLTIERESPVLIVEGDARSLLMAERVSLNFLQHLSGIATLTARFCQAVRGYRVKILDTRKTTPGLRALEKWAVRLGGGRNHRHSLSDGILIKENHLALAGHDVASACRLAREGAAHGLKIEVEAQTLDEVRAALDGQADIILLDNMDVPSIRTAVDLIKGRALVEVSGGVTLATVREIAAAGPDFISIGALTHSAPAANLSMDILPLSSPGRRR